MQEDPLRYILTTSDGSVEDYGQLPSNTKHPGECTYENPFLTSMQSVDQDSSSRPLQNDDTKGYAEPSEGGLSPSFDSVSIVKCNARTRFLSRHRSA